MVTVEILNRLTAPRAAWDVLPPHRVIVFHPLWHETLTFAKAIDALSVARAIAHVEGRDVRVELFEREG